MSRPPARAVAADGSFAQRVVAWQRHHGRHGLPWQRQRDPYRVWLSEVMLQQTQVATVLAYYPRFLARFPDVAALVAAPLDDILALWSGLGYYSRARHLHRCAQAVVAKHGGRFPPSAKALSQLPGIGRSDGIVLRLILWLVLTAMAVGWVLRYAARVRADPRASVVGFDQDAPAAEDSVGQAAGDPAVRHGTAAERLTATQKWVLAITIAAFGLMIFSVIPWSSVVGGKGGPAAYYVTHAVVAAETFWIELNWWFPQLAMLFLVASVLVGLVARMNEKEIVRLIAAGASDMMSPAMVMLLAGGVSAIMTHTQTLDTILHAMEQLIAGASAGAFAVGAMLVNVPLAFLIPSSSGHAALAMPLLTPLADFAGVSRPVTITAWILAHGLTLLVSPTNVVVVGGLAIAKVGFDKYLRLMWPLLLGLFIVAAAGVAIAAVLGRNGHLGFTLLELMFVVVILSVLMAIAYPAFYRMRERAKEAGVKTNAHTVQMAAEDFAAQNAGVYATDDTTTLPGGDTLVYLVMPSLVNPFDPTDASPVVWAGPADPKGAWVTTPRPIPARATSSMAKGKAASCSSPFPTVSEQQTPARVTS